MSASTPKATKIARRRNMSRWAITGLMHRNKNASGDGIGGRSAVEQSDNWNADCRARAASGHAAAAPSSAMNSRRPLTNTGGSLLHSVLT
jgi:hypothetical protein